MITDKALCEGLSFNPTAFTQIKSGARNAPESLVGAFKSRYETHYREFTEYLQENTPHKPTLTEAVSSYIKEVDHLMAMLISKDEVIKAKDEVILAKDKIIQGLEERNIQISRQLETFYKLK